MKHLVIFGAPGSGKGTQSKKLEEKYGVKVVSTGDLLRAEVAAGSEIGKSCADIMAQGKFPDNQIIFQLIELFWERHADATGILYDGFPRTVEQAEFLLTSLRNRGETIEAVIDINVDQDVLVKRIAGRFACAKCGEIYNTYFKQPSVEGVCDVCGGTEFKTRADDNVDTVKTRMMMYEQSTAPVLDFFMDQQLDIIIVDGMQSVETVFHQIENVM
jgi:adenylate kinase